MAATERRRPLIFEATLVHRVVWQRCGVRGVASALRARGARTWGAHRALCAGLGERWRPVRAPRRPMARPRSRPPFAALPLRGLASELRVHINPPAGRQTSRATVRDGSYHLLASVLHAASNKSKTLGPLRALI